MALNLQEILGLVPPQVTGQVYDQIGVDQKRQADLTAENVAVAGLATAKAQAQTARFAESGNVEALLNQQVQEFNKKSAEAQFARANATARLQELDQKTSVGLFDSPLDWFSNQITFEDDKAKTEIGVAVAKAKADEVAGIQSQITSLNSMTQSASKTFADMAQTVTADTAERAAQIERTKGNVLANQTFLSSVEASNGYKVRLRGLELQEESAAREKERMTLARAEAARNAEEATNNKNAFDLMWRTVELGNAQLGLPPMAKPASRQEFDLVYKTNPNVQAALSVGWNARAGKVNVLGESLVESASILKATDSQGTQLTKRQVKYLKDAVDGIKNDPAFINAPKEQQPAMAEKMMKQNFIDQANNADRNPDTNPTRLPAPALILIKPLDPDSDPEMIAMQKALTDSQLIKDLTTAQKLASDKPQEIIKYASEWAAQKGVSVSEVSKQVAALYEYTQRYYNEANRTVGLPPVSPKYTVEGGLFGDKKLRPSNAAEVQAEITKLARIKKFEDSLRANQANIGQHGFGGLGDNQ